MNDASKKIQKELEAYKKTVMEKKPETIYQSSMDIIFAEGTAWYTKELAESSEELAALILVEGKTLRECTQHVIKYARAVCGGCNGDLPTEKFHEAIWEYYKMPVKVASTAIKDAKERAKAEAVERSAKWKAEAATRAAQKKAEEARKKREETGQMSMFDMFSMATAPVQKEQPASEADKPAGEDQSKTEDVQADSDITTDGLGGIRDE